MLKNNPENGTMSIRGVVGQDFTAEQFIAALDEQNGQDVEILLDSEGGLVTEGLAIYNAIATYNGDVTIRIDTLCASIATVIACAASRVEMNSTARYMIHKCWVVAIGNSDELRSLAVMADMLDGDMADIYEGRSDLTKAEIMDAMTAETWYSPDEALAAGFVDEVIQVTSKSGPQASACRPKAPVALFEANAKIALLGL